MIDRALVDLQHTRILCMTCNLHDIVLALAYFI
jgi:hypothetical protein